ncbi:MAG TPA: hypothetical protein VES60_14025 [Nakamurella sp.]|nr:hypothetical protein [Nakamurella sp.]
MAVDGDATGSGHLDRWERGAVPPPGDRAAVQGQHAREKDQQDFDATLPVLGAGQRGWLWEWLVVVHPGHAWPALT